MLNIIVCIKQVPMVSELPWDSKTGTLKRELAQGMMDPASRRALEAALKIKEHDTARISAVTMGPPQAEEVIKEAIGYGVDDGRFKTRWPAVHLVGKDILRFHAIIWPAMCLAAGVEPSPLAQGDHLLRDAAHLLGVRRTLEEQQEVVGLVDLQAVIALLKDSGTDLPLQYENFRD